jgi:hypothetical protein
VSYKVVWNNSAVRIAQTWALPDTVFVEMWLQVNRLANNPADQLVRMRTPFDGLVYSVEIIDPANRLCVHQFQFLVLYSQDEERLFIARGVYSRRFG